MAKGDGKNRFYRTLHLDEYSRNALKFYRELFKVVIKDNKKEVGTDGDKCNKDNGK